MTVDFYDLFAKPQPDPSPSNVHPIDPARATRYATRALEAETQAVAAAAEGTRNHQLNRSAFNLGQLVAAGHLDHGATWAALATAARAAGLDESEIRATLASGLGAGQEQPRVVAELPPPPAPTILADSPPANEMEGAPDSDEVLHATWAPIDLDPVLDGTYEPETPTLMPRTDGANLLYPGRIHSFHGESESGKSLVAQGETARLLQDGQDVLYVDFEADHASVTGRLLELGATKAQVRNHFTYVRPEVDPRRFDHEREAITALLDRPYALAVIDGVTDALGIFGQSSKDNDDIAAFMRLVPRTVARKTGAAVVLIDHVSKDTENRGRFAIGGQAKMASLDGAAYVIEVAEALGRSRKGLITMRVGKDRPGGVRAHAGTFRKLDRTQEAARVIVDSTSGDHILMTVAEPRPDGHDSPGDTGAGFRPTRIMERVSRALESADEPMSMATIEGLAGANRNTVRTAIAHLVHEHFVREERGARNARLHRSIQPYREVSDPASDAYVPAPTTLTSPTSPDLAPTSPGRGENDLAQPCPSPTGQGEVDQATSQHPPRPHTPGEVEMACTKCFRPIPAGLAKTTNGRCATCFTYADGETR